MTDITPRKRSCIVTLS